MKNYQKHKNNITPHNQKKTTKTTLKKITTNPNYHIKYKIPNPYIIINN